MTATLKSMSFVAALTLATALGMTAGQTIIHPDSAQAGIIKSVKSAAKKVGGAAKTVAKGAVTVARQSPVAKAAVEVANTERRVVKSVKTAVRKVGSAAKTVAKTINR